MNGLAGRISVGAGPIATDHFKFRHAFKSPFETALRAVRIRHEVRVADAVRSRGCPGEFLASWVTLLMAKNHLCPLTTAASEWREWCADNAPALFLHFHSEPWSQRSFTTALAESPRACFFTSSGYGCSRVPRLNDIRQTLRQKTALRWASFRQSKNLRTRA